MVNTANELLTNAKDNVDQVKADPKATVDQVKEAEEKSKAAKDAFEAATSITQSAGLQIGWKGWWTSNLTFSDILAKVAGLLVSIFAVSLGAPFWFDLLQRFMQVRATGSRETTDTEGWPMETLRFEDVERRLYQEALNRTNSNVSAAARLLGLSRGKLRRRLGDLNIDAGK